MTTNCRVQLICLRAGLIFRAGGNTQQTTILKISKDKFKLLPPIWTNSPQQYRMGTDRLRSSSVEKELWILVGSELNLSQQCALAAEKANSLLGCMKGSTASRLGEMNTHFYSELVTMHLDYYAQFCGPSTRKTLITCSEFSRGPPSWLGLELFQEVLRELDLFSLGKRWLWGCDLTAASPVPMVRLARRQRLIAWSDDER